MKKIADLDFTCQEQGITKSRKFEKKSGIKRLSLENKGIC